MARRLTHSISLVPARAQEAALRCAAEADPLAASIGAANTLVRLPEAQGGGLKAYNTDCEAAIQAVERGLAPGYDPAGGAASPLQGRPAAVTPLWAPLRSIAAP